MDEKDPLSVEESFEIIQSMIDKAKNSVADNSYLFLLWGWLVFIACIAQFTLKVFFNYTHHYYPWAILIIALGISIFRDRKNTVRSGPKTYVDYSIEILWMAVISSYALFTLIFFRVGWEHCYTFYIFLMSIGCFLTGKLLSFYPLVMSAAISGGLALLTTFISYDYDILLCGLAILISYIIPGYLLRLQFRAH